MLVTMNPILEGARERRYGIAAPGVNDMQTVNAVFEAARELRAPIILDCVEMNDIEAVADITRFLAVTRYPEVPAALNLDHGRSFDVCAKAIRAGFTSVMIDCIVSCPRGVTETVVPTANGPCSSKLSLFGPMAVPLCRSTMADHTAHGAAEVDDA